jgi:hypothetical protein
MVIPEIMDPYLVYGYWGGACHWIIFAGCNENPHPVAVTVHSLEP